LKIEQDLEYDVLEIFGAKIPSLTRAQNGLNDIAELTYSSTEHYPYWNLLYNCSEIGHIILEKWK